ncbi:CDP-glucose 4,6-dehydratase [Sneathiella sp. CAU 1612]|uniref:CDP-glucose 4,6-dehydratase n=1 Tax=Sneathiella sedimenti TaxID=2816034 RepID=A0ABS3F6V3_9PROT|nr:CDP-glucose 4,6-dehydratase [Sneathiella sedimenti]MBO0334259.1 CDP-glucose 4,6-dehydratase [Sneathiella sedimenti]
MTSATVNSEFWNGRRVLLTGHTGFKGAWAAAWLVKMGAKVTGVSLPPEGDFSLYNSIQDQLPLTSHFIDIRDAEALTTVVRESNPEIVLHMAAQALVRRSYREPTYTYETNVMGTVNLLEALRELEDLKAALIITSDKVYQNIEDGRAFKETDPLGGDDPYSSSKAACEIATASLAKSYFLEKGVPVATGRAGNVIGGGDFSEDRLIPDIWRAAKAGQSVTLRYPGATRPWQHVLESVSGYLVFLQALAGDSGNALPKALNFGPQGGEVVTVGEIAREVQKAFGIEQDWALVNEEQPPEKSHLALDASLAKKALGWQSKWTSTETLTKTVEWYKAFGQTTDIYTFTLSQIDEYEAPL